jgi:hypothetical protein
MWAPETSPTAAIIANTTNPKTIDTPTCVTPPPAASTTIAAVPANTRQKVPIASATQRRSESSILQAPSVTGKSLAFVARLH